MEIRINALKFTATEAQLDFIKKKVKRLERIVPAGEAEADVTLSLQNESKKVVLKLAGNIIERTTDTFENSITAAVDAMKEKIVREKEKAAGR